MRVGFAALLYRRWRGRLRIPLPCPHSSGISRLVLLAHVTPHEMIRATMGYTLGEAAKATGRSKPTIQRAVKSGLISASKTEDGSYAIDPAELHRVFPPVTADGHAEPDLKQDVPPRYSGRSRGYGSVSPTRTT